MLELFEMSSLAIEIRKAIFTDINALVDLWIENIDLHKIGDLHYKRAPDAHESFRVYVSENISNKNVFIFVAATANSIIGFCSGEVASHPVTQAETRYGAINELIVTKMFMRQRVGEKLCLQAIGWFQEKGIDRIEIRAATTNTISVNFWNKMGLRPYSMSIFRGIW
jgi:ribosomal protein S18 acetylase RimI-like enzyme